MQKKIDINRQNCPRSRRKEISDDSSTTEAVSSTLTIRQKETQGRGGFHMNELFRCSIVLKE